MSDALRHLLMGPATIGVHVPSTPADGCRFMLMKTDAALWRRLRVGDRTRLVDIPLKFLDRNPVHLETTQAYKYLVKRRRPVSVYEIDEYGMPWVKFQFRARNGRIRHDYMAINHSGIILVKTRQRRGKR
jgi:hypothetical protein